MRAADQPRADRLEDREPPDPGWRDQDGVPAGVSDRGHRVREPERSRQQAGLAPESKLVSLVKQQRNYGLLEGLGVRPRTTYLAVVRNPNPKLTA